MHRKSGLSTWRWGGLLLALLAATAFATGSGPGAVRKQVESSLLVTGKIDIEPLIQEPAFIPQSTSVLKALEILKSSRVHMAFVVDEYGSFEGVKASEIN